MRVAIGQLLRGARIETGPLPFQHMPQIFQQRERLGVQSRAQGRDRLACSEREENGRLIVKKRALIKRRAVGRT